ncbi:MAG: glycerol-3-phosphate dehydrogenase/oxidase [Acidobacteria bacterium]|nr:glycerol-3-phosphate dehydrogenase/oxidase [Acidobacteriota bacterium]
MIDAASSLSPAYRLATLNALDGGDFDVIIVGGGITGIGCALDAASRGLTVALVEQRDLGSGTSSRSSKLIHGGLRYLEQLAFGLVREALAERALLRQKIAPHLVWPIPFVYPLRHRLWERIYVGAGIAFYDVLAKLGHSSMPYHKHLSKKRLVKAFPGIKKSAFIGGIRYFDAGMDDARFVVAAARTAAREGALILTSARVTGFIRDGEQVVGVSARCLESGRSITTRARVVINATGVWTDSVENLVGDDKIDVTASKGIHIVIPRDRIDSAVGFITKTKTSVLFLIPHEEHWFIGTTDTAWELDLDHPAASRSDIRYVLDQLNKVVETEITEDDIIGVYAGLRPLVTGNKTSTAKASREHSITHPAPGLVTIAGGKFTTYRVMAHDTVDRAFESVGIEIPPSRSDQIAFVGADGFQEMLDSTSAIAQKYGVPETQVERLLHRYGSEAIDVLDIALADRHLSEPLPAGAYLRAEVKFAVEHEGALHLDDVLARRTRLSIERRDRGVEAAATVAEIMGGVLGWDSTVVKRELEHYEARVAAERESQTMPDDATADAARLGAPDVRTLGDA